MTTTVSPELGTYVYSVVRAVPHATRDEAVNIGIVVLADDATFSSAQFTNLDRVRRLNPRADTKSIELFVEALESKLPFRGRQLPLTPPNDTLSTKTLLEWSREFGGLVRLTEPRAMLGKDADSLAASLYQEFVAPIRRERTRRSRVAGRAEILHVFDREVEEWQVSPQLVEPDATVHGKAASHRVDRVVHGTRQGQIAAIVGAISFALEPVSVYGVRGSLIVATDDLRQLRRTKDLLAYAVYADAPQDRLEEMRESARLFKAHDIQPVNYLNMEPVRTDLASILPM